MQKNPGVAAVLSFILPGVGQIYNGQISWGLLLICLYFLSLMLIFVFIGIITTPVLWVLSIYDAYKQAEKSNEAT